MSLNKETNQPTFLRGCQLILTPIGRAFFFCVYFLAYFILVYMHEHTDRHFLLAYIYEIFIDFGLETLRNSNE